MFPFTCSSPTCRAAANLRTCLGRKLDGCYRATAQSQHDEFLSLFLSKLEFQTANRLFFFFITWPNFLLLKINQIHSISGEIIQNTFEVGKFIEDLAKLGQIWLGIMTSSHISMVTDLLSMLRSHKQVSWLPKQRKIPHFVFKRLNFHFNRIKSQKLRKESVRSWVNLDSLWKFKLSVLIWERKLRYSSCRGSAVDLYYELRISVAVAVAFHRFACSSDGTAGRWRRPWIVKQKTSGRFSTAPTSLRALPKLPDQRSRKLNLHVKGRPVCEVQSKTSLHALSCLALFIGKWFTSIWAKRERSLQATLGTLSTPFRSISNVPSERTQSLTCCWCCRCSLALFDLCVRVGVRVWVNSQLAQWAERADLAPSPTQGRSGATAAAAGRARRWNIVSLNCKLHR